MTFFFLERFLPSNQISRPHTQQYGVRSTNEYEDEVLYFHLLGVAEWGGGTKYAREVRIIPTFSYPTYIFFFFWKPGSQTLKNFCRNVCSVLKIPPPPPVAFSDVIHVVKSPPPWGVLSYYNKSFLARKTEPPPHTKQKQRVQNRHSNSPPTYGNKVLKEKKKRKMKKKKKRQHSPLLGVIIALLFFFFFFVFAFAPPL